MMHMGLLLILTRKCAFYLATFVLRSVWAMPTQLRIQRYIPLVETTKISNNDKVIKDTLKRYWITALLLKLNALVG
jgi:hypothetical protein